MELVGQGQGYYFTRGKMIPITWKKDSHFKTTHYYDDKGNELLLNPGKTWISVYPLSREELLEMHEDANATDKPSTEEKSTKDKSVEDTKNSNHTKDTKKP